MARRPGRDLTVGAMAALALLILAIAIMAVGGQSHLFGLKARYRVVFPNTEGLRVGSPVMIAGVQVGTVTEIHLPTDPKAPGIEAELGIERAYEERVRENSVASLHYLQWLSGEKYVEVTPGDPDKPVIPVGGAIPVVEETKFLEKGVDIADNLNQITVSLKEILGPLQRGQGLLGQAIQNPDFGKETLEHLTATLANLEDLTGRLRRGEGFAGKLLTDPTLAARSEDLSKAIASLASFTEALGRKEGAIGALLQKGGSGEQAINEFRDAAASLKRTAERLESKQGLFGKLLNDPEYSDRIAKDLGSAAHDLSQVATKINSGQGTLGALVNDRVLYDATEDIVAGVGDSKFARWLLRHYQKKGIEEELQKEKKQQKESEKKP